MKELQTKPLSMGHKEKPIIFWNKEQNTYSMTQFNNEIKSFFIENQNYNEFYLECEFGFDNAMMSYVLEFTRNKTETVQDALFNHAIMKLEDAIEYLERIKIVIGINALLSKQ